MRFSIEVDTGTEEIAFLKEAEVEALAPFFFRGSKYRNFLPFAYFDNRGKETVVHGYAGVMKNTEDDVYECLYNVELPEKCDVYICPNLFKSPKARTNENLVAIQNIVIDVDCHSSLLSQGDIQATAKRVIQNAIIKPNMVVFTGRGFHLWYKIAPAHVSVRAWVDSAVEALIKDIKQYVTAPFEVDEAASKTYAGLKRFPKSYNTKAGCFGSFKVYHQREQSFKAILSKLESHGVKPTFVDHRPKPFIPKWYVPKSKRYQFKRNNYTHACLYRQQFMDYMLLKTTFDETTGNRDRFLFAMYITLRGAYDWDDAKQMVLDANKQFEVPLRESEIHTNIFNAVDKKPFRMTNRRFFEYIGADAADIAWYEKRKKKERTRDRKRKQAVQAKKQNRNAQILAYHKEGLSVADIAQKMGIARNTIYSVIRSNE